MTNIVPATTTNPLRHNHYQRCTSEGQTHGLESQFVLATMGDEQASLQVNARGIEFYRNAVQLKSIKGNGFTGLGGILFYNLDQALQLGIV